MSLSPISPAVVELLSHRHTYIHTYIHTAYYFRVRLLKLFFVFEGIENVWHCLIIITNPYSKVI